MTKRQTQRQRRAGWKAQGLCQDCGTHPANGHFRCELCRVRHRQENLRYRYEDDANGQARSKALNQELRLAAFQHYGMECSCCGEKELRFLTLDHINNDGYKYRKTDKKHKSSLYRWAKDNGYPPILRTQCFNCNCGRAHNGGVCPHEVDRLTDQHLLAAPSTVEEQIEMLQMMYAKPSRASAA